MRSGNFLFLLAVIFTASISPTLGSSVEKSFQTEGWILTYELSSVEAEPSSTLTLNVTIQAKSVNYDFGLTVKVNSPLIISREAISYSELHEGDVRQESLTITVPSSVQSGEVYVINLRAQSHSNPAGIGGLRAPWDYPEYVFDTTERPEYALRVTIVLRPHLSIVGVLADPSTLFEVSSKESTVKLVVKNLGAGSARNVDAKIFLPEGLALIEGNEIQSLGEIAPGSEKTAVWRVKSEVGGAYRIQVTVSARNHDPISATTDITMIPLWSIATLGLIIVALIVYIVYRLLRAD